MALTLGQSKKIAELSLDQISYLAAKARLPEKLVLNAGRNTVEKFLDTWMEKKSQLPLSSNVVETIGRHLKTIPLVKVATMA